MPQTSLWSERTYGYALKLRGLPAPRRVLGKLWEVDFVKGGMAQEASIQAPAGMSV